MNNHAFGTIAGLELAHYGTTFATVFEKNGKTWSPDFAAIAQAYGAAVYYSYIIVPEASPVRAFAELRGKSFAFTDPLSNTGKLVPTYMLARMNETPANREAKIDLQTRVINAVITGSGWDTIPADVRRQADTPWFKAFLLFDPAAAMKKVSQPLLVVHGALDQQVAPANSERLATIGAARKGAKPADTERVVVPGVNHLLLAATTGDVEEYASLTAQPIAPGVVAAIVNLNAPGKQRGHAWLICHGTTAGLSLPSAHKTMGRTRVRISSWTRRCLARIAA
jgi:pimeloyl-ACP methyl ester carboxylesterase